MSTEGSSLKSIILALTVNTVIAIAKFFAAIFTGSGSMLAEAIHSSADCGNQILLLLGLKAAKREPDDDHPLGYGKAIYFWSFIVALMLFSLGGMFSIYEGVHKLRHPEALKMPMLAVAILIFSIILESIALRGVLKQIKSIRKKNSLWRWFRDTRKSELIVILAEDSAAVFGLFFAFAAILLTHFTGNPTYDSIGSIVIGVILIIVAVFVSIEVESLMVGESVDLERREEIHDFIEQQEAVTEVFNIITLQMGSDVMLSVKLRMKSTLSARNMILEINKIEKKVKQEFKEIRFSFFEPDVIDDDED